MSEDIDKERELLTGHIKVNVDSTAIINIVEEVLLAKFPGYELSSMQTGDIPSIEFIFGEQWDDEEGDDHEKAVPLPLVTHEVRRIMEILNQGDPVQPPDSYELQALSFAKSVTCREVLSIHGVGRTKLNGLRKWCVDARIKMACNCPNELNRCRGKS